jgi:PAS domain S-box-containing protein
MMKKSTKRLLAGLAVATFVWIIFHGGVVQEERRFQDSLRASVADSLGKIRVNMESEISANFFLTRGLMAYVSIHPDLDQATFIKLASDLFQYRGSMRSIALAPDNEITFVYPLEGNERAIGLKYETNQEQWQAVERAIVERKSVMAGPIHLVQGGTAFVSRTPIYIKSPVAQDGSTVYWGLASVVIDERKFLENAGFFSPEPAIRVAMRGVDGLGAEGGFIAGDREVFEQQPTLMQVRLPEGSWQLAAMPLGGWHQPSPFAWWLRIGGWALGLLAGLSVILWQKRQDDSRLELEAALRSAELANDSLAKSETFLSTIVENIPNMIFIKDARELRFVRFNRAGEKLLGYSRDELLGKNDYDFFPREEADSYTAKDREVLETNSQREIQEEIVRTRHQGTRFLRTKKIPLQDKKGSPEFLMGISEDITEQKLAREERERLESQLRQSLKMESIGTLAGGIAHDFNNILAAILGYAEMALSDMPHDSPARFDVEQIQKAGDRAKVLVKHILSFSKKEPSERRLVEIQGVIYEVLKLLRATIPSTIRFETEIDAHCGSVLADSTQIYQVMMNICTNAAQAMTGDAGVLTIKLAAVELTAKDVAGIEGLRPGPYARVTVSDTGSGISSETIDRIFDPYFTTRAAGQGSGMGLAVVMGIVKAHDGAITVSSVPGHGSTFTVYFPQTEGPAAGIEETHDILIGGSERVLVIDDEPDVAEITRRRIERLGYKVKAMTSSLEALKFLQAHPDAVDVVVSDQTMPDLTGEALARELREIRPGLPVILCTGYSSILNAGKAREAGVKAFVLKPVELVELAAMIRRVLDKVEITTG